MVEHHMGVVSLAGWNFGAPGNLVVETGRESMNQKHFAILENASDAILVSDASQRIVFWNKKAAELLGYAAEEVIGRRCHKVLAECMAAQGAEASGCAARCAAIVAAEEGCAVAPWNLKLQRPDGSEQVVTVDHTVLFGGQAGQRGGYLILHFLREAAPAEGARRGLRIRLLGQTRVQLAQGKKVDDTLWRRRMVRALLALLALHRHQGIHRDVLLDLLWPDKERELALRNLNTNIYYLRRALEPELGKGEQSSYIQIDGELYRLANAAEHWVDVEEFEEALDGAQRAVPAAEAIDLLETALELYHGDFLSDVDLADSRYFIRGQHLCERHLAAMKRLAALYEAEGRERQAEALYLKILGQDHLQEDACRHAMRLMLRRGDRSGALARFRRLERYLASELGLKPEAETIAMYRHARGTSPFSNPNGNAAIGFGF